MPYLFGERRRDGPEPIAICGMACRLPGQTDSPSALWKLLLDKKSTGSAKVPDSRFNIDAHFHENLDRPGSFNVLGGYFLDGPADQFDPTFFNMTPVEAMWLDPQQRKMLEVCYEAIEGAGVTLDKISGSNTGVWVGSFTADYQQMTFKDADFRHSYAATGVDPGIISNRIGNVFDLRGPSCTINTACSSSVYAIHNACHALRARDCDAALVGGVNLILTVDQHMNTAKLGVLSPHSRCNTFDAAADGYGRGEGAGALYLKRLDDAVRDGDAIRSVIRASAVNTNGKVPGYGITFPNVDGQERVIRAAYKTAGLDPAATAYVECHGTGTRVGDPIEVRAVARAMNDGRPKDQPLVVGAVKPNIGHSEAASGVFAVIKAALMVESGVVPGVAGLKTVSPSIPEGELNVHISRDTASWPEGFASRRAGVSSFGYGGTNGHVIVEDVGAVISPYQLQTCQPGSQKEGAVYDNSSARPLLVTLSAHDKATLNRNLAAHAAVADHYFVADLAHTLNQRRSRFATRGFVVASDQTVASDFDVANFKTGTASRPVDKLAFVFTGQGAQWAGLGRDAMRAFPVFRETIRRLDRVLKTVPHPPDFSLEEQLETLEGSRINNAQVAQPTLVAAEIALVDLLDSWGVEPAVAVGHSAGEYAAAYAAGLASAPDLIVAAHYRGHALREFAPKEAGSMLAVGLGAQELGPYLDRLGDVVIACENSPKSVTLSGPVESIQAAAAMFSADSVFARELRTGMAYHSPAMQSVAEPMERLTAAACRRLDSLDRQWKNPRRAMISSVTGELVSAGDITPAYWAANLTSRVLFDTAVTNMAASEAAKGVGAVVEIGPHSALAGPLRQIFQGHKIDGMAYVATLVRNADGARSLLKMAGELFLAGYAVDLQQVNKIEGIATAKGYVQPRLLVDLPPYQWNYEKRYWAEPRASAEYRQLQHARHDLLGSKILGLASQSPAWRNVLRIKDVPWLSSHRLGGSNMFPAAGHMALAVEAARQQAEIRGLPFSGAALRNLELKTALIVPDADAGLEIQTRLTELPSDSLVYHFSVSSCTNDAWSVHSEGEVEVLASAPDSETPPVDLGTLSQRHSGRRWNDAFRRVGFEYGRAFDGLDAVRSNGRDFAAAGDIPVSVDSGMMGGESRYVLHPATVDSLLQLCIVSIHAGRHREMPWGVIPVRFDEVVLRLPGSKAGATGRAVAWNESRPLNARRFSTDAQLAADESVVLDIRGLHTVAYEAALPPQLDANLPPMPFCGVVWKPDAERLAQALSETSERQVDVPEIVDLLNHKQPLASVVLLDSAAQLDTNKIADKASLANIHSSGSVVEGPRVAKLNDASALGPQSLVVFSSDDSLAQSMDSYKPLFDARTVGLALVVPTEVEQFVRAVQDAGFEAKEKIPFSDLTVVPFSLKEEPTLEMQNSVNLVYSRLHSARPAALADALEKQGLVVKIQAFEDGVNLPTDTPTLLFNPTGTILSRPDPLTFDAIKTLMPSGTPVVWLTAGVNEGRCATAATVAGFLRVVRAEESAANLRLLDFDYSETFEDIATTIKSLVDGKDTTEHEYWLHHGIPHVSRVVPNTQLAERMDVVEKTAETTLLAAGQPLRGTLDASGLTFAHHALEPLSAGQVDVQVESVEFRKHDPRSVDGPRVVYGSVISVGESVDPEMLGKHVVAHVDTPYDTIVRVDAVRCVEAAGRTLPSLLPALCTAATSLQSVSRSLSGKTVVLLPTTEPLAHAFSLLATAWGFKLEVVSDASNTKTVLDAGSSLIIAAPSFSPLARDLWRRIPSGGALVLFDGASMSAAPDASPFARGARFSATTVASAFSSDPAALHDALASVLPVAEEELQKGEPVNMLTPGSLANSDGSVLAFHYGQDTVSIVPPPFQLQLSSDDVYLLVGCLGGLGRSLTSWMMARGARHFAFISRSGADKPEAAQLIESITAAGAQTQVFRGDAASKNDVTTIVHAITSGGQRIRGVVHAAMVLQDAILGSSMTLEKFAAALRPKIDGALSLHHAFSEMARLPQPPLDFFVMTSSVSGVVGLPGQSNYAAANCALDNIALQRRQAGLRAASLVLPMVLGVGVVAESGGLETGIARRGQYGIDEPEMLRAFEAAMSQGLKDSSHMDAAILLGMDPGRLAATWAANSNAEIGWVEDARFSHLRHLSDSVLGKSGSSSGDGSSFAQLVAEAAASGFDEALALTAARITHKCASILMLPVDGFELDSRSVASYGLDSMIGAELRNWLLKDLGLNIAFQDLLSTTLSFNGLARLALEGFGIKGEE